VTHTHIVYWLVFIKISICSINYDPTGKKWDLLSGTSKRLPQSVSPEQGQPTLNNKWFIYHSCNTNEAIKASTVDLAVGKMVLPSHK